MKRALMRPRGRAAGPQVPRHAVPGGAAEVYAQGSTASLYRPMHIIYARMQVYLSGPYVATT